MQKWIPIIKTVWLTSYSYSNQLLNILFDGNSLDVTPQLHCVRKLFKVEFS